MTPPTMAISYSPPPITSPQKKPTPPTATTLSLLQLCNHLHEAKQVHALMIKTSQISHIYSASRLAEFYAVSDNGNLEYAETLTNSIQVPYRYAWNTLIRGYLKKKNTHKAISLYGQMMSKSVEPDRFTFTLVLKACTMLGLRESVKQFHCQIIKRGVENGVAVRNKLIHVYAVNGCMVDARKMFDKSDELDIITWNSLLEGYAGNGDGELVLQVFNEMPQRDVVSWNTVIAYYIRVSKFAEAVEVFQRMQEEGERPDEVTLVSVLTAIAHLGALAQGKWVHAYIRKHGIELDENLLGSALVNMYSKCGCLGGAMEAFNETKRKKIDTWNAMIGGLASNGQSLEAIDLFSRMENTKTQPDAITFSCILNACSHGGLVEEGLAYFGKLKTIYGIEPDVAHYGCIIDLLGRAGLFDKVEETMKSMPMEPDAIMWKSLLSACKIHTNFDLGEKAGLKLIKVAPDDHASYILLSNIYASANKWNEVNKLRKTMIKKGIKKPPGCSSIEVDGLIHEFMVGDTKHCISKEIYDMVEEMEAKLKVVGYHPDTKQVLLDIEEEGKQTSLGHHSEKLAVAFGFISTKRGTTIRVFNNIRMCSDCHSTMKLLSMVYNRDLIIRDSNRFHHFREGSCSCMDYW